MFQQIKQEQLTIYQSGILNGLPGIVHGFSSRAGGCSKEPLELLKGAGVDMSTPAPVDSAMEYFATLVDELDELTK